MMEKDKSLLSDIFEEEMDLCGGDELSIGSVAQTRPTVTVFILADTSRSMIIDGNIHKLNSAIQELRPQLIRLQGADVQVSLAIYTFGKECAWQTVNENGEPDAVPADEFVWNDVSPMGNTPLGKAFAELNRRLSRKEFLRRGSVYYAPIILLVTDGTPTDEWEDSFKALKENKWFRESIRIAIGPEEAREMVLADFTGKPGNVVEFPNSDTEDGMSDRLSRLIVKLAVRASRVASQTRSAASFEERQAVARKPEEIAEEIVSSVLLEVTEEEFDFESGEDSPAAAGEFDEEDIF